MSRWLETARAVASGAAERAAQHDLEASFPSADVEALRSTGLLGLMVPERLGGAGATFEDYVEVAMALAAGNPALALVFNMHVSVTGALATATEDLARALGAGDDFFRTRDRVLGRAAEGALYAVAISEADVGSRLSQLDTTYQRQEDGYRITGRKAAASAAGYADGYMVAARASDASTDDDAVSYFLVEAGSGLEVVGDWDPLGMRATASRGVLIDAHVPADALLGVEGVAVMLAYAMPQWLVASYAAVYAGVARAAVDEATGLLSERGAAAVPGASRSRLGRADATAASAELSVLHAARLADRSPADAETIRWLYRAKLLAGDAAMEVAASLAETAGLRSLRRGAQLERLFRDARLGAIMPPSSDVCAEYLAALALGLDPRTEMHDPPW